MTDQYPHERSAKDRENSDGEATPEVAPFEHGGQPADVADPSRDPAREDHAAAHGRPTPDAQAPEIARTNAPAPGAHTSSGEHAGPFPASRASYGVGPFSVREVALLGVWVVAFFVSFFRTNILDSPSGVLVGGGNVWLSGLWWIPAVAVPTVAVGLVVLRRLSPQGIRRVGSLGIDQFASVAFTVSALVWVSWVWDTVAVFNETGIWTRSWVIWVEAVVLLVGVALTVFAPFIPPFSGDFRDREEVPAHRNARPIRPVTPRPRAPRAPRPVPSEHAGGHSAVPADAHADHAPTPGSYTGSTDLAHDEQAPPTSVLATAHGDENDTDIFAPLHGDASNHDVHDRDARDRDARDQDTAHGSSGHAGGAHDAAGPDRAHAQAFWALAPEEREIVDDYGTPIFRIGPTAWALVIEDRGETFVVRHDDGRIGYLHDVSGVTRG